MEDRARERVPLPSSADVPLAVSVSTSPAQARRPWYPRSYVVTDSVAGIERIFDDGISICIWRRGQNPKIREYLSHLSLETVIERTERVSMDRPVFDSLLQGFPDRPGLSDLMTELQGLTDLFATLCDGHRIGVRLTVTRSAPCPRFHVDQVGLRLICILQGPGTEWLEHQAVDRRHLGARVQGHADETSGLLVSGAQIHRMQTFDVGVFKGESWPNNAGRGAVHRSPALVERDPWRVMVSLDELD